MNKKTKVKITKEGQPCRKCNTPVIVVHRKNLDIKEKQTYYFTSWFSCTKCKTMYVDETKKVLVGNQNTIVVKEKTIKRKRVKGNRRRFIYKELRKKGINLINEKEFKRCKNKELESEFLNVFGYEFIITYNKRKKVLVNSIKRNKKSKKDKRKIDYTNYINSKEWRSFKMVIVEERGMYCEKCDGSFKSLDLHHIHYNNFKKELREDVVLLCRGCHKTIHDTIKKPPYTIDN